MTHGSKEPKGGLGGAVKSLYAQLVNGSRDKERSRVTPHTGTELARSVRKPQAPPGRVDKTGKEYDRRRTPRDVEEHTEESR
jgi:hypothetical protein